MQRQVTFRPLLLKVKGTRKTRSMVVLQFASLKGSNRIWTELVKNRSEFQSILHLLVKQEQKENFSKLNWVSYIRHALCICEPSIVRFFLRDLGGYLFHIVAQLETSDVRLATSWLHEDGIQLERDSYLTDKHHPVHNILCLSDLYLNSTRSFNLAIKKLRPSKATLDLMLAE